MKGSIKKTFWLTEFALKNKTSVLLLTILFTFIGISTYVNIPRETYPEINLPQIFISTPYPGNSPENIENLITRHIEKELKQTKNIKEIASSSLQDFSIIVAEFETDISPEEALDRVKDAIDKAKSELPTDLDQEPNASEFDASSFPILRVNISGDYTFEKLKYFADKVQDEIESISSISSADISGLDEKEVRIIIDPHLMDILKISFQDISSAISKENITASAGAILEGEIRRTVTIEGEYDTPEKMGDIIIKNERNHPIFLRDVATIEYSFKEKESYARLNKKRVVALNVIKRSGKNIIESVESVQKVIEKAKISYLPEDMEIILTNDQSIAAKDSVSNLENSIILGVLLVVGVLLFFLNSRNALFVGVAIPLSMFITFIVVDAIGYSLNMMTLFSLLMALGMLVDNGIVVVENVYRKFSEGTPLLEATRNGVGEVALPIISSTATTLAAFLPLAFWPGIMGEFMKILPISLIITLTSSLFVALFINPVIMTTFMKIEHERKKVTRRILSRYLIIIFLGLIIVLAGLVALGNILICISLLILIDLYLLSKGTVIFSQKTMPYLEEKYISLIRWALKGKMPYKVFGGTFGLLLFSLFLLGVFTPKTVFFPNMNPLYINTFIEFPVGIDVEKTNQFTEKIESQIYDIIEPYKDIVLSVSSNIGKETSDPQDGLSGLGASGTPHKARVTVDFVKYDERKGINTWEILSEIREKLERVPGVIISVNKNTDGPPVGKAVSIEIIGEELEELLTVSENVRRSIIAEDVLGLENLISNLKLGKPELKVNINREIARKYGVSTIQLADELRTSLFGKEISKFKDGKDDYKINIRLKDEARYTPSTLFSKKITFRNQSNGKIMQVPLSTFVDIDYTATYEAISRKDQKRVVTLSSNVLKNHNPSEVNVKIKELLKEYDFPRGITYKFGGEQEKQAEELAFLSTALLIAVSLIFLIIVSQFNSISAPLIIMLSVLFSTIGVFLGLVITQNDFIVIMSMIGIISLAGIVVNNAIVLIDFIELRKAEIKEQNNGTYTIDELREIIIDAGRIRLRPVLLTAITTILGLLPLAVGLNIDFIRFFSEYNPNIYFGGDNTAFWGPMSTTIIHGLLFATVLTLVVVPVMYLIVAKIKISFNRY